METAVATSDLHYFRCEDCLSAFTVKETDLPGHPRACEGVCICGGPIHYMGKVHETFYHREGEKAPCDKRCTNASGPQCNCRCNCKNHGTGKLVTVVVEEGKVRVTTFDDASIERGHEWRELQSAFRQEILRVWGSVQTAAKEWKCSYQQRYHLLEMMKQFDHSMKMRVYSRRAKRVSALLEELRKSDPIKVEPK